jgi:hypothetical protein
MFVECNILVRFSFSYWDFALQGLKAGLGYAIAVRQGNSNDGFMVTRHFTGAWDQVDQESQGLSLEVIEQVDDSRRSVAYWYTYDADRKTAWYLGIGDLDENQIVFELYESVNVGFMQDDDPDSTPVQSIDQ